MSHCLAKQIIQGFNIETSRKVHRVIKKHIKPSKFKFCSFEPRVIMRTSQRSYHHLTKGLWIEDGFHDHKMKKLFTTLDEVKSWHVERFHQSIFTRLNLGRSTPDVASKWLLPLQESYIANFQDLGDGYIDARQGKREWYHWISMDFMESPYRPMKPQKHQPDPEPKGAACIADDEWPGVSLDMVQVSRHHAHQKDQPDHRRTLPGWALAADVEGDLLGPTTCG